MSDGPSEANRIIQNRLRIYDASEELARAIEDVKDMIFPLEGHYVDIMNDLLKQFDLKVVRTKD